MVNPNARRHAGDPDLGERLHDVLGRRGVVVESKSEEELPAIAQRFRRDGVDVLAIAGGDGTIGAVLTGFRATYGDAPLPMVALLRGGTMNTVANGLDIARRTPQALLAALVDARAHGDVAVAERATMDVSEAGGVARVGFLFGTGVFAAFLTEYYAGSGGAPSPASAAWTLSRMAVSVATGGALGRRLVAQVPVDLAVDGEPWPCPSEAGYMTVAAGTVAQVGLGFRPFPRADEAKDAFHLLALHSGALATLRILPRVHRGEGLPASHARDALARAAVLTPLAPPLRYMLDGELGESDGPLTLRAGPTVRVARI